MAKVARKTILSPHRLEGTKSAGRRTEPSLQGFMVRLPAYQPLSRKLENSEVFSPKDNDM